MNQRQCKRHRNEETQKHRSIENISINTIKNNLIEFGQKQHEKFIQIKNLIYYLIRMNTFKNGVETPLP